MAKTGRQGCPSFGHPDQMQLVFGGGPKRAWRQPPRTRAFSDGVHPSLQVGYRNDIDQTGCG